MLDGGGPLELWDVRTDGERDHRQDRRRAPSRPARGGAHREAPARHAARLPLPPRDPQPVRGPALRGEGVHERLQRRGGHRGLVAAGRHVRSSLLSGAMAGAAESLATTLGYHERTKHYPGRYARALGHMDWATQPDPFRRFVGAPLLDLDLVPAGSSPGTSRLFSRDASRPNRSVADRSPSSFTIRWRSRPGSRPVASAGRCGSTRRAGTSIRPRATSSRARRRDFTTGRPSSITHPASTRSSGGRSCSTRPGPRWRGSCRPEACWWDSPRSTGARPGSTASGRSATATTTSATPSAPSPSPRRGSAGRRDSAKASSTPTWPACWELDSQSGPETENADCLLALFPQGAPFSVDQQRAFTLALPPGARLADRVAWRPQPPQPRARSRLARDRRGRRGDAKARTAGGHLLATELGGQLGGQPWPHRRRFAAGFAPDPAPAAERGRVRRPHRSHPRSVLSDPAQDRPWPGSDPVRDAAVAPARRSAAVRASGRGRPARPLHPVARSRPRRRPCAD